MKIRSLSTLVVKVVVLVSFIYAGTISPMISMRFGDVLSNDIPIPSTTLGIQFSVGDGVFAGIESDIGTGSSSLGDSRLFVKLGYGAFGLGTNQLGQPQFTVGGYYDIIDNFGVSLDYVLNQLTDADGAGGNTDPFPDQLRVSLSVNF